MVFFESFRNDLRRFFFYVKGEVPHYKTRECQEEKYRMHKVRSSTMSYLELPSDLEREWHTFPWHPWTRNFPSRLGFAKYNNAWKMPVGLGFGNRCTSYNAKLFRKSELFFACRQPWIFFSKLTFEALKYGVAAAIVAYIMHIFVWYTTEKISLSTRRRFKWTEKSNFWPWGLAYSRSTLYEDQNR